MLSNHLSVAQGTFTRAHNTHKHRYKSKAMWLFPIFAQSNRGTELILNNNVLLINSIYT